MKELAVEVGIRLFVVPPRHEQTAGLRLVVALRRHGQTPNTCPRAANAESRALKKNATD